MYMVFIISSSEQASSVKFMQYYEVKSSLKFQLILRLQVAMVADQ